MVDRLSIEATLKTVIRLTRGPLPPVAVAAPSRILGGGEGLRSFVLLRCE